LDQARTALDRHLGTRGDVCVERVDAVRTGGILLTLAGPRRRWFRCAADSVRELTPETDPDLPIARKLPELQSRRRVEVLAYRPGRRIVLRHSGAGPATIVKGYRRRRVGGAVRNHATAVLAAEGLWLRVPKIVGRDDTLAFFAMPDLGTVSFDLNADPARFARIGGSLRCFRRYVPDVLPPIHDHGDELEVLDTIAGRALATVGAHPDGWALVRRRLDGLAGQLPELNPGLAHRDLHDGQLADLAHGVGVLDFDLLCRADRMLDVANLSAHLYLRSLQAPQELNMDHAAECSRALVVGSVPIDEATMAARFRFYRSATFLRLALVYSMRPPWAHLSPPLVQLADQCFEGAFDGAA
jgi:hypothetical protein